MADAYGKITKDNDRWMLELSHNGADSAKIAQIFI